MSQAGEISVVKNNPSIPTSFVTNSGTAIPVANELFILGTSNAAGGVPVQTTGSTDIVTIEVQKASAQASSSATNAGLASFNNADFTVDANGYVTFTGTGAAETLSGNSGGAVGPTAGNINTVGTGSITVVGNPGTSTTTVELTGLTNHSLLVGAGTPTITSLGVATNGQLPIGSTGADPVLSTLTAGTGISITNGAGSISIAVSGSAVGETITGNAGGALSPTAGNWNILGTGSITTSGTGSTLTTQLTGLTNHALQIGAGTATLTQLGAGTTGQVLQTNTGADPTWSTATYPSTTTINQLLYSSSANVVGGLATANKAVLTSGATGVPVMTALATDGQLIIGSTAGVPAAATLTAGSGVTITNAGNSITIAATGSGGVITTIDGDSGSITGATVTIYANNSSNTCGSTVKFVNSGTTSTLNVTDSSSGRNTIMGLSAGNASLTSLTGVSNTGFGYLCFQALTSGSLNSAFGENSLNALASGFGQNTAVGATALSALVTGGYNIALGQGAGGNYNTSESSNIIIGNVGTASDANKIIIGTQGSGSGQQNTCYIAGIAGVAVSNLNMVTINTSTGQLGSQAFTIPALTLTTVNHAASPYTVLAADQFLAVTVAGGVVTVKLPNAPTTGRVIYIKDSTGAAATSNISVTTVGGAVTIDGQTTYTMATNYQSLSLIFDGSNYEVF